MNRNVNSLTRFIDKAFSSKYLFYTNVSLGTAAFTVCDAFQQRVEHMLAKRKYYQHDYRRSYSVLIGGSAFGGFGHFWYKILDKNFPGKRLKSIAPKLVLEILVSPIFAGIAFFGVGLLEGKSFEKCYENFLKNLPIVLGVDCFFWIPLQAINFYFLPSRYRFLYVSSLTVLYDMFLSYVLHRDDEHNENGAKK